MASKQKQDFWFKMAEQKDMHSSPPDRAPKLQLAVVQRSSGGRWNPPKRDTPRPKTKKQPQWDGRKGKITINSNPIPTYGWVTHRLEKSNTKEVLELLWRFWTPSQASQSGYPGKALGIPRKSVLAGQQHLIIGLPHDCGRQRLQSQRAETKFCMHQDPEEKSSDPTGLPAGVGGPPVEHGLAGAHHRDGGIGRSPQA